MKNIDRQLTETLQQAPETVSSVYLFGSRSRGDGTTDSDFDLAVLLAGTEQAGLVGPLSNLSGLLERELGQRVDLVDLRSAPPDLVHRIMRDGRLLLDRDPEKRITFEVRSRNEYFDLLPYLEQYRKHQAA